MRQTDGVLAALNFRLIGAVKALAAFSAAEYPC
jgi:hypothetical protein